MVSALGLLKRPFQNAWVLLESWSGLLETSGKPVRGAGASGFWDSGGSVQEEEKDCSQFQKAGGILRIPKMCHRVFGDDSEVCSSIPSTAPVSLRHQAAQRSRNLSSGVGLGRCKKAGTLETQSNQSQIPLDSLAFETLKSQDSSTKGCSAKRDTPSPVHHEQDVLETSLSFVLVQFFCLAASDFHTACILVELQGS